MSTSVAKLRLVTVASPIVANHDPERVALLRRIEKLNERLPGPVQVSVAHIARGHRGSLCSCPIALALAEQACFVAAQVDGGFARVWLPDGTRATAALPPSARRWVKDFDGGYPVGPISFRLIWCPERVRSAA
jgi:hypothetical protein